MSSSIAFSIAIGSDAVSALATTPQDAVGCLVLAHGAGAGMHHPHMVAVCDGLAARGIATVRYQFPYMERGLSRPDPPQRCHRTVAAAVAAAHQLLPTLPLFAGGKSFGGRMTSQAQALAPLPHVRGLCFFGFPLLAPSARTPTTNRADHLFSISIPMLFLQGARDALAPLPLVRAVVARLPAPVSVKEIEHADHSFHVLVRSGTSDGAVMASMLNEVSSWMATVVAAAVD